MIATILIVPLVYFINAFLIGRLIKKWRINVNQFLASIIGFIALFDVLYLISIWMYFGHANVWSYFIVFGMLQGILIVFYIMNWKFLYITWSVDYRKIILFLVMFSLTILLCWLNFREYKSEFGLNWMSAIQHNQLDIRRPMAFGNGDNIISNFSSINIMNLFWIDSFRILSSADQITFCSWSWTIIVAGFTACLSTWMIKRETSILRVVLMCMTLLAFEALILAFIESFAIGDAWIILLLFVYIMILFEQSNSVPLKLFNCTILSLGFLAVSWTSFFTMIGVWIFSIYYVIRNKENSINFTLFLTWPLILAIFSLLSIYSTPLLPIASTIYLLFVIVLLIISKKIGTPSWETKIALSINKNSGKIVYTGLIIFIALMIISNFSIFQEIYKWNAEKIDYRNFLTFSYTYIWSINIESVHGRAIFNALIYSVFVSITITYLVIRKLKKHKLYWLCKNDNSIRFGIISCILFINPLVIHVLNVAATKFALNTLDLNMMFVVPIFSLIFKFIFNHKINSIDNWKYNWY